jgi:ribonuclease BN (tRNA processing enzyme)
VGYRIESGRRTLAYTGDARLTPALVDLARSASLLLAEATLQEGIGDAEFVRRQLLAHMTARQAGELAQQAGARALVLTHLMYYLDADQSAKQAQAACLCPVSVAREHAVYEVG